MGLRPKGVRTPRAPRPARPSHPPHRDPRFLGLIVLSGAVGTSVRAWLETAYAAPAGTWPWATFWINIGGAFLLGFLLEALARTGPDRGWRRLARLGAGTGVLGGFTTYSTFAVETALLAGDGVPWLGLGYAVGSVVAGLTTAWLGFEAARAVTRGALTSGAAR
ncbi:MAG: fluoride efflux transporter FluC [Actinomycetota bacterium]